MRKVGSEVDLRFTKWGGADHWEVTLELLGEDLYCVWLGGRAGVTFARPGVSFETTDALVVLVPMTCRGWRPSTEGRSSGICMTLAGEARLSRLPRRKVR